MDCLHLMPFMWCDIQKSSNQSQISQQNIVALKTLVFQTQVSLNALFFLPSKWQGHWGFLFKATGQTA